MLQPLVPRRVRTRPTRDWTVDELRPRAALRPDLRSALEQAVELGEADVVLRSGDRQAVVLVSGGKLAWAAAGGDSSALIAVFVRRTGLSPAALRAIFEAARRSGQHFGKLLLDRDLLEPATLRSVLLEHLARRLLVANEQFTDAAPDVVASSREPAAHSRSLFSLVQVRAQFELLRAQNPEDDLDDSGSEPGSATDPAAPEMRKALEEVLGWDGAMGAAVLDCEAGQVRKTVTAAGGFLVERIAAGTIEVVRAQLRVGEELGAAVEEMLFTFGQRYHLVHTIAGPAGLALLVLLDRRHTNLAMARLGLRSVVAELER